MNMTNEMKGEDSDWIEVLKKKCDFYHKSNVAIHLTLKTNNKWLNGYIREFISDGFILDEFKDGSTPVFYMEVCPNGIEQYTSPDERLKGKEKDGKREINPTDKKVICESK